MKKYLQHTIMFTLPILGLMFVTTGCEKSGTNPDGTPRTTADEVGDEIKDAAHTTGKYIKEQADAFRAQMADSWDKLKKEIDDLQERAEAKRAEWNDDLTEAMRNLEEKKMVYRQKMDKLQTATGDAWEDAKDEVEDAWEDVKDAYEKVREEFREENPAANP